MSRNLRFRALQGMRLLLWTLLPWVVSCGTQEVIALSSDGGSSADAKDAGTPPVDAHFDDAGVLPDTGLEDVGVRPDAGSVDSGQFFLCGASATTSILGVDTQVSPPVMTTNGDEIGLLVKKTPAAEVLRLVADPLIDAIPISQPVFEQVLPIHRGFDIAGRPNRQYRIIADWYDVGPDPAIVHESTGDGLAMDGPVVPSLDFLSAAVSAERAYAFSTTDNSLIIYVSDTSTTVWTETNQIGRTLFGELYPEHALAAYVQDWDFPPTPIIRQFDLSTGALTGPELWGPMCGVRSFDVARYNDMVFLLAQCSDNVLLISYNLSSGMTIASRELVDIDPMSTARPRIAVDEGGYLGVLDWPDNQDHPRVRFLYVGDLSFTGVRMDLARSFGTTRAMEIAPVTGRLGMWATMHASSNAAYVTRLSGCPTP